MKELWKNIPNYDGYQVSNLGRIRSLDRQTKNNNSIYVKKGCTLKNNINNKGYEYVYLSKENYKKKYYVHRLVAQAFIPNLENKKEVNHLDCDPLNNKVDNLQWVTHKENMGYMSKLGRSNKTGLWLEKISYKNKLGGKKVAKIDKKTGKTLEMFETIQSVKEKGFRSGDVCKCCKGKRKTSSGYIWRYVDDR